MALKTLACTLILRARPSLEPNVIVESMNASFDFIMKAVIKPLKVHTVSYSIYDFTYYIYRIYDLRLENLSGRLSSDSKNECNLLYLRI